MFPELDGVLLIDKPEGITSAGAVRRLKGRLRPKKIGHGGTLDPFATGLLVMLLGKGTKLSSHFLEGEKSYSGIIRLGTGTDTDDITGMVTEVDDCLAEKVPPESRAELTERLKQQFTGEIAQVPPRYSALKIDGERSYDRARKGLAVSSAPRTIRISVLELEFLSPDRLEYRMRCSKGTYVRSLARDIGSALGTVACVETLRREETSGFGLAEACPLDEVTPENVSSRLIAPSIILERLGRKSPAAPAAQPGFVSFA